MIVSPKMKRRKCCAVRDFPITETKRLIGKGGFGSVFLIQRKPIIGNKRSRTDAFPAEFVVKTAKLTDCSTLRNEKKILRELSISPYVIRCYGDEEKEELEVERSYNLYLEYCSGGSLWDQITKFDKGLLPWEVKSYTRDILQGLVYIHDKGIVHCDIKPGNILLVPHTDGGLGAKLADFGLASNVLLEDEEKPKIRGTWRYLAPELMMDNEVSCAADIWALGCTVVEMLSGEPVWGHGTSKETIYYRTAWTSEVPELPEYVSGDAKDFVRLCFDRDYISRKSAEELLQHPFLSDF